MTYSQVPKVDNHFDMGANLVDAIVPRPSCLGGRAYQEVMTLVAVSTAASGGGMLLHCVMDKLQAY
jgi:hypothetical protein